MKPLLFMDVDGVLNVWNTDVEAVEYKEHEDAMPVLVPVESVKAMALILPHFEPVWATSWRDAAHQALAAPLGLTGHPWEVLPWDDMKLTAILERAGSRPWAWVDDDIEFERSQIPEEFSGLQRDRCCMVEPQGTVGLTEDHGEQLVRFASSLS